MPDVYTTTSDPTRPMVCASCHGHFAGTSRNIISATNSAEETVVVALCDNCLREIGAKARG